MANLSTKASDIDDPAEMLRRIAYRNARIIERIDRHDDPASFAKHLASRTRSDLRRLASILGVELHEGTSST
jgi:hypothetical protein